MNGLRESGHTVFHRYDVQADLTGDRHGFHRLEDRAAYEHLTSLSAHLRLLATFLTEKMPKEGGANVDLRNYIDRFASTLDVVVLKHRLDGNSINADIKMDCAIDGSDSGFPLFVRDFPLIEKDKEDAEAELGKLPEYQEIIDGALFAMFRNVFPDEQIMQKLRRDYYGALAELEFPQPIESQRLLQGPEEGGMRFYRKSVARLDREHNIPRFYTVYFRVPEASFERKDQWRSELLGTLHAGLELLADVELAQLAKAVDMIAGIHLDQIERYDIGPFYGPHTVNSGPVGELLANGDADSSMMMFRRHAVQRMGEREMEGIRAWWRGRRTGDRHAGIFSPVVVSPQHVLLPHRLIQKAYSARIDFGRNVKMYGITMDGEISD